MTQYAPDAIESNQRAYITARCGMERAGASRAGFIPKDTQGASPGTPGGFYIWRRIYETVADAAVWIADLR